MHLFCAVHAILRIPLTLLHGTSGKYSYILECLEYQYNNWPTPAGGMQTMMIQCKCNISNMTLTFKLTCFLLFLLGVLLYCC